MSGSSGSVTAVPIGGVAFLDLPGYFIPPSGITSMLIQRAVSGASGIGAWTQVYSGAPVPQYVDPGDATPSPLSSGSAYMWRITDNLDSLLLGPITPVGSIVSQPDYLTNLLIRCLQAGINNLTLPSGVNPVQVTTQMPQQGWQALPFVVVNLDLIQQTEVQIGEDVPNPIPPSLDWTIWSNAKRIWRVSVFSRDAQERDYYRDTLLMIFRVLKATVFTPLGYNVSHSFQAASGTDAKEWEGHTPGFYYADLMLEIDGVFNTAVLTNYGLIEHLDISAVVSTVPSTVTQDVEVPLTGV